MKTSSRMYAEALVDLIMDKKSRGQEKKIATNFVRLLLKNKDFKIHKEILNLTSELMLERKGGKEIILETAREMNGKKFFADIIKKGDVVLEKINPDLIAGIKITVNNKWQLDFSLQRKLNKIFK